MRAQSPLAPAVSAQALVPRHESVQAPAQVPDVSAGNDLQAQIKIRLQRLRDKALDDQAAKAKALRLFNAE